MNGLVVILLGLGSLAAARAEEAAPQDAPPVRPIQLTLQPAAEPNPALKVQFLPEVSEQISGNAALAYYRAFAPEWMVTPYRQPQIRTELMELAGKRLRELPPKAEWEQKLIYLGEGQLRELRRAARMSHCDWDLLARLREGGLATLLPDVYAIREFGSGLALRARAAMLRRKPEQALELLKLQFTLARHLGEAPAIVHSSYGMAVARQALEVVEDLIEQPGCPNLYWALTALPDPIIDGRQALQAERLMFEAIFPDAEATLARGYTPEQFNVVIDGILDRMRRSNLLSANEIQTTVRPTLTLMVATAYPDAKAELIASGIKPEDAEAMPAAQVVLIQFVKEHRRHFDALHKWSHLSYREAEGPIAEADRRPRGRPLLERLYGSPGMVLRPLHAKANLQRRIAALRCIEAVRLHAAANGGAVPATLEEIKAVPVPRDPALDRPFGYRRTANGFELTAEEFALPAYRSSASQLRYEVTFAK